MRLSICIPTYNRAKFLPDLFDSILAQTGYACEVEVVVSDNASADDTQAVIERYRGKFDRLVYQCASQNMGADWNYLRIVELASGDFCWLMGSDDVLEEGAIAAVEQVIAAQPEIAGLSVGRVIRSFELERRREERLAKGLVLSDSGELHGADAIFRSLAAYLAYLSGQIVRRSLWNEVVEDSPVSDYFNAYVHVYVIGRMVQRCPHWYYLAEGLVGWREDNDSFLSDGEYNRLRIDVVGYEQLARGLFGAGSPTYHHINRDVSTGLLFRRLLSGVIDAAPRSFFTKAAQLTFPLYARYPAFWIKTAPLLLLPRPALRLGRTVVKSLRAAS